MTVYYLVKMWYSSSYNHIRKDIVKAYKNSNDLDNYIANNQDVNLNVPQQGAAHYYKKETVTIDDDCKNVFYLMYLDTVGYNSFWQSPVIFSNKNAALVQKTIVEYGKIQNNANYEIDSCVELRFIPIQ